MAKKKKKKKDGPKPFFSKKKKRQLIKLVIFALLASSGYVLAKPEVIKDEQKRQQVEQIKEKVLSATQQGQEEISKVLPKNNNFSQITQKIPKGVVLGEEDIYVEDAVKQVSQYIQDLPEEQINRIKSEFCADLISSPTPSPSPNSQ